MDLDDGHRGFWGDPSDVPPYELVQHQVPDNQEALGGGFIKNVL
jgi:hypothetical protein